MLAKIKNVKRIYSYSHTKLIKMIKLHIIYLFFSFFFICPVASTHPEHCFQGRSRQDSVLTSSPSDISAEMSDINTLLSFTSELYLDSIFLMKHVDTDKTVHTWAGAFKAQSALFCRHFPKIRYRLAWTSTHPPCSFLQHTWHFFSYPWCCCINGAVCHISVPQFTFNKMQILKLPFNVGKDRCNNISAC